MKNSSGFSLIELMIVVVILGILSSLAFGAYRNNVIAANRTEGRSALQTAAGTLEKCRSLYGSYNHANCNYADFTTDTNLYQVTDDDNILASSFTLTATPVSGEPQAHDADCTTLTLTNTGVRGGSGADASECW
jgi:type IV pilus assembly protein PilE